MSDNNIIVPYSSAGTIRFSHTVPNPLTLPFNAVSSCWQLPVSLQPRELGKGPSSGSNRESYPPLQPQVTFKHQPRQAVKPRTHRPDAASRMLTPDQRQHPAKHPKIVAMKHRLTKKLENVGKAKKVLATINERITHQLQNTTLVESLTPAETLLYRAAHEPGVMPALMTVLSDNGRQQIARAKERYHPLSSAGEIAKITTRRQPNESDSHYVLRLMQNPDLLQRDISMLSGVSVQDLRYRPEFKILSPEGEEAQAATPQQENESGPAYVRRIYPLYPDLCEDDFCVLAGMDIRRLRKLWMFKSFTKAATNAMQLTRQLKDEAPLEYARRLHVLYPGLTPHELSAIARMDENDLRQRAEFKTLSEAGLRAFATQSRRDDESPLQCAIRLFRDNDDLTFGDISYISGMSEPNLRQRPEFKPLTAAVEAVQQTTRRQDGESNHTYAVRIITEHPQLTPAEICVAVGVSEQNLRQWPEFIPLTDAAKEAGKATPQQDKETPMDWAVRLHKDHPGLTIPELSSITKASGSALRKRPEFRDIVDSNKKAMRRKKTTPVPRLPQPRPGKPHTACHRLLEANNRLKKLKKFPRLVWTTIFQHTWQPEETPEDYAVRLQELIPNIPQRAICRLTKLSLQALKKIPAFQTLSDLGKQIHASTPRGTAESAEDYARRLLSLRPKPSYRDISLLTGEDERRLRYRPEYQSLSKEGARIKKITPRKKMETLHEYAGRLHKLYPRLPLSDISVLTWLDIRTLHELGIKVSGRVRDADNFLIPAPVAVSPVPSLLDFNNLTPIPTPVPFETLAPGDINRLITPLPSHISSPVDLNSVITPRPAAIHFNPVAVPSASGWVPSVQQIQEMSHFLLRQSGSFNNQLADDALNMLLASGIMPAGIVLVVNEFRTDGSINAQEIRASAEPQLNEIYLNLVLQRDTNLAGTSTGNDASAHYWPVDLDGRTIDTRYDGNCLYESVSIGLGLLGFVGFTAEALRNAVADEFLLHSAKWLQWVDMATLYQEWQEARTSVKATPY
ncbi:MAG: hypothetical protein PW844_25915 [Pantoea sp.]|uniref:hypothetical protein n=1 Tax=Pantoea sp. TaxID=69393 RepID=UPI0023A7774B|nr:hypothetical protein [Pantoea sp.]MDE1189856.1 hypothetical protein [Pantoea sp.]